MESIVFVGLLLLAAILYWFFFFRDEGGTASTFASLLGKEKLGITNEESEDATYVANMTVSGKIYNLRILQGTPDIVPQDAQSPTFQGAFAYGNLGMWAEPVICTRVGDQDTLVLRQATTNTVVYQNVPFLFYMGSIRNIATSGETRQTGVLMSPINVDNASSACALEFKESKGILWGTGTKITTFPVNIADVNSWLRGIVPNDTRMEGSGKCPSPAVLRVITRTKQIEDEDLRTQATLSSELQAISKNALPSDTSALIGSTVQQSIGNNVICSIQFDDTSPRIIFTPAKLTDRQSKITQYSLELPKSTSADSTMKIASIKKVIYCKQQQCWVVLMNGVAHVITFDIDRQEARHAMVAIKYDTNISHIYYSPRMEMLVGLSDTTLSIEQYADIYLIDVSVCEPLRVTGKELGITGDVTISKTGYMKVMLATAFAIGATALVAHVSGGSISTVDIGSAVLQIGAAIGGARTLGLRGAQFMFDLALRKGESNNDTAKQKTPP